MVSTHIMEEAEALCSSLAIQGAGEWRCFGNVPELRERFCKNLYQVQLRLDMGTTVAACRDMAANGARF